jgi:hypothetical protein
MRMMIPTLYSAADEARATARDGACARMSFVLANLYVAMKRIHQSLEREEIIAAIEDVIATQIGSEDFAIFERESGGESFSVSSSIGVGAARMPDTRLLEEVIRDGAVYSRDAASCDPPDAPAACIPLKVGERVTGIIVIHRLFPHKERLDSLDLELCDLLGDQGGVALYASALHARWTAEEARQ